MTTTTAPKISYHRKSIDGEAERGFTYVRVNGVEVGSYYRYFPTANGYWGSYGIEYNSLPKPTPTTHAITGRVYDCAAECRKAFELRVASLVEAGFDIDDVLAAITGRRFD